MPIDTSLRFLVMPRPHRCKNCGHVQDISTNHAGGCIDYCKECSWKPSFGTGKAIPFGGCQAYREFEMVAQSLEELEGAK